MKECGSAYGNSDQRFTRSAEGQAICEYTSPAAQNRQSADAVLWRDGFLEDERESHQ